VSDEMGPGVGIAASVRPFSCHVPTETIIMSAGAVERWTALRCWVSISAMNSELLSIPKRVHFVALSLFFFFRPRMSSDR
jgi:hypothetical protein